MAIYPGTERIINAAAEWRERSLLGGESVLSAVHVPLWTTDTLAEIKRNFVDRPDTGSATFMDKFRQQMAPASPAAKRLAAEMLWVLLLFPNNISGAHKANLLAEIWGWSGSELARQQPLIADALRAGIGGAGQAFNNYRPAELTFFLFLMLDWRARARAEQEHLLSDPWRFGAWVDAVPGAANRQFRHMLLHLLFPEFYERVASSPHKRRIDAAFREMLDPA
ncbi:MAG TPA: hypothetical protein VGX50_09820, partial [Longimicrobium sp.]|nr:hypothetical protein [Longimicrobium sp.]